MSALTELEGVAMMEVENLLSSLIAIHPTLALQVRVVRDGSMPIRKWQSGSSWKRFVDLCSEIVSAHENIEEIVSDESLL